MLLRRAFVTFTLGPLVLFLIYLGGWYYFLAFATLLLIGVLEYRELLKKIGYPIPIWLLVPSIGIQWLAPVEVQKALFSESNTIADLGEVAFAASILVGLGYALWLFEKRIELDAVAIWMATSTGIIYLGWLGSHFFRLRVLDMDGMKWAAMAMLSVWIADSAAYTFGKTIGQHKMAPKLSPNKTMEGYFGGILVGTLLTMVIGYFLDLSLFNAAVLGALVSVISPLGDLGISMLKRRVGVKDSGNFLPGHGGALDRTDSLIWSVVMAFYLVK